MNKLITHVRDAVTDVTLRAYVALQIFAAQEPVRVRAGLASLILAAGGWLGLDVSGYLEEATVIGAVALPIIIGESTRAKVSPTYDH
ncbi:hypothetical protein AB0N28_03695 [Streptomyces sp. NPDC051130]|uniref:hypothetical protein n=1 Tax=Streptomyces sp. NPDC051130 TaxID=3157223 RepID=UPI003413A218